MLESGRFFLFTPPPSPPNSKFCLFLSRLKSFSVPFPSHLSTLKTFGMDYRPSPSSPGNPRVQRGFAPPSTMARSYMSSESIVSPHSSGTWTPSSSSIMTPGTATPTSSVAPHPEAQISPAELPAYDVLMEKCISAIHEMEDEVSAHFCAWLDAYELLHTRIDLLGPDVARLAILHGSCRSALTTFSRSSALLFPAKLSTFCRPCWMR